MKLSLIIPAYNEALHIQQVISDIPEMVSEIIVVDDGSRDDTPGIVTNSEDDRVSLIRHDSNQGVGAAMISGYQRALEHKADIVVKIDGDGQMDPRQIPELVLPLQQGFAARR